MREQKRAQKEYDIETKQSKNSPSLSVLSPSLQSLYLILRSVALHAPVIDREDGFTEPIMEERPWLVINVLGAVENLNELFNQLQYIFLNLQCGMLEGTFW